MDPVDIRCAGVDERTINSMVKPELPNLNRRGRGRAGRARTVMRRFISVEVGSSLPVQRGKGLKGEYRG